MTFETEYRRQALQSWKTSREETKQEIEADFYTVKVYLHSLWNIVLNMTAYTVSKKRY